LSAKKRKKIKRLDSLITLTDTFPPILWPTFLIIIATLISYANSFPAPFIFDDLINIIDNPSIRDITDIRKFFLFPSVSGLWDRPVVNFSLAINYALSGENPWSYHALNLFIHILSALCLLGIIRRTLLTGRLTERYRHAATPLALAAALIWALHPLNTQAVTYVIQRCESLMGLFYFLTIYCAIRSWSSTSTNTWRLLAILFLLLGIGTKEVIITAPFVVFAYEWTFLHPSLKEIWRRSRFMYLGFGLGIITLSIIVLVGGTVTSAVSPLQYWQTQSQVILHYLRLALWPQPLCFDYGWPIASLDEAIPAIFILMILLAGSLWLFIKKSPFTFPAVWFFAVLAPTSIVPLPDPAWEYRMYLPMAALSVIAVIGFYGLSGKLATRFFPARKNVLKLTRIFLLIIIICLLGSATWLRNQTYRQELTIWQDTVIKRPQNSRAHLNLGVALDHLGKINEAIAEYRETIRLNPLSDEAYANLGFDLYRMGKTDEAIGLFHQSILLNPQNVVAHSNLGIALWRSGKKEEAYRYFKKALHLKGNQPQVHSNLGCALNEMGRYDEAISHLREAIYWNPKFAEAHANLGYSLESKGLKTEAIRHYQKALRLDPELKEIRYRLERLKRHAESNN
jgi:protein O-mannosyl-transferase